MKITLPLVVELLINIIFQNNWNEIGKNYSKVVILISRHPKDNKFINTQAWILQLQVLYTAISKTVDTADT